MDILTSDDQGWTHNYVFPIDCIIGSATLTIRVFDLFSGDLELGDGTELTTGLSTPNNTWSTIPISLPNTVFPQLQTGSITFNFGAFSFDDYELDYAELRIECVPEPSTFALLSIGFAGAVICRYGRGRRRIGVRASWGRFAQHGRTLAVFRESEIFPRDTY
jgi:hypothetical protein